MNSDLCRAMLLDTRSSFWVDRDTQRRQPTSVRTEPHRRCQSGSASLNPLHGKIPSHPHDLETDDGVSPYEGRD